MLKKITSHLEELNYSNVPNVQLCRFYSEKEHVNSFENGEYRFGNLKHYRKKELEYRADPTELESSYITPDGVYRGAFSSGTYYALCFTELNKNTDINYLSHKFGKANKPAICSNIENNIQLTQKIMKAWGRSKDINLIREFQWFKVIYNKGEVLNLQEINDEENNLFIYQKPKAHEIHKLKRIRKTPPPATCVDTGGPIGLVSSYSSLDSISMLTYNSIINSSDQDWEVLPSEINNFEAEQEWRLVFYAGDGYCHKTNRPVKGISDDYYFL